MPSFDVKSELDSHEVMNGVDQANRVIENRFDFKGTGAKFSLLEGSIILSSKEEFQLHQMLPILKESLAKRRVDLKSLNPEHVEISTGSAKQKILLREGIDQDTAKKIVQIIKSLKSKVQVAIQGESIRVSGKKRDDLQSLIQSLKETKFEIPLQFKNFRD